MVPADKSLHRALELAAIYLKAPEITRRNARVSRSNQSRSDWCVKSAVDYRSKASVADLVKAMQASAKHYVANF